MNTARTARAIDSALRRNFPAQVNGEQKREVLVDGLTFAAMRARGLIAKVRDEATMREFIVLTSAGEAAAVAARMC